MLGDRQELDMGEAEVGDVGDQPVGELVPGEEAPSALAPPRAGVHLVDRDRHPPRVGLGPERAMRRVAPGVVELGRDHRGGGGAELGGAGEGVGLERQPRAVRADDLELVGQAGLHAGDEDLPDRRCRGAAASGGGGRPRR